MARRICAAKLAFCLAVGMGAPVLADEFDLPPDIGPSAIADSPAPVTLLPPKAPTTDPTQGPVAGEVIAGDMPFDLPPDLPGGTSAPVASGPEIAIPADLPATPATASVETADAPAAKTSLVPRNSTLTLEGRFTYVDPRQGDDITSFRGSAHWRGNARFSDALSLRYNLRLRGTKSESTPFSVDDNLRLDVQELALGWQASPGLSFEIGRINLRNGVAHGFNPTDWFKADSLVYADSFDPADRRDERLGTMLLTGTTTFGATLVSFGYRPEITASTDSILAGRDIIGLGLTRTNPSDAWFLKFTPPTGDNIALTGSVLVRDGDPGLGAEISGAVGENLVLYAEAFVQKRRSLAAQALSAGQGSPALRRAIGADDGKDWQGQLAIGGSWSLPAAIVGERDVSLVLEYHYNQAGLSSQQNRALSDAGVLDLSTVGALRGYAARQQEPLAQSQIFTRFSWNDFWKEADFAAIAFYVPDDDSGLLQLSAGFPINDNSEISLRASRSFGDDKSIYGSATGRATAQIAYRHTF